MGTGFEAAFICQLSPELPESVLETLRYMVRSEKYTFETPIFIPDIFYFEDCGEAWRTIIWNGESPDIRQQEEYFTQERRSSLQDGIICFRDTMPDDCFDNVFTSLIDWLATISITEGVIGYYLDIYPQGFTLTRECHLLSFQDKKVQYLHLQESEVPDSLLKAIDTTLGGTGFLSAARSGSDIVD
jgi:hypothetical protein